jgi:hypothetical protein
MAADEGELEQWLDAALKHYAAVEVRPDLEQRIVARIRTEPPPIPFYRKWGLPVAAAAGALALMLAVGMGKFSGLHPVRETMVANQNAPMSAGNGRRAAAPEIKSEWTRSSPVFGRRSERVAVLSAAHARPPQFPSPRMLSEQDKLLLEFLRQAPREEVQAALAQKRETAITDLSIKDLDIPPLANSMRESEQGGRN